MPTSGNLSEQNLLLLLLEIHIQGIQLLTTIMHQSPLFLVFIKTIFRCLEQPKQAVLCNLQKSLIRCFNCALREMKNGALCALVDAKMTNNGYKTLGALGTVILLKMGKI
jgi:hypothetical protein